MTGADIERFYARTHPRLWAYLVRTTNERALAEEIAQEAFVRLLESRGAALPDPERTAYLYRIAENLVRDTARRGAHRQAVPIDPLHEPAAPEEPEPFSRRMAEALAGLGPRDRKLLWLAYVEEWDHREISRLLGIAAGSVRVLLHRARRRIQQLLDEDGKA
jgi:RNA polymerase sigma-70 factor (ECF subfamily)